MNKGLDNLKSIYKKHQKVINISLLVLLPIIIFYNSLGNYFSEVDDFNIMHRSERSIVSIFTTNEYGSNSGGNYRPLEVLSHLVDNELYGDSNPFGRHISNLLLHILNGFFVYTLCFYLTKNKFIGLISGLFFSLHISNSNIFSPVTWIQGRLEVLVTFFFLLSIILFIRALNKGLYIKLFVFTCCFCTCINVKGNGSHLTFYNFSLCYFVSGS